MLSVQQHSLFIAAVQSFHLAHHANMLELHLFAQFLYTGCVLNVYTGADAELENPATQTTCGDISE